EDGTRVPLLVEIKAPAAADLVVKILLQHFDEAAWQDPAGAPAVVLSFHEEPLRRTAELAPQIPLMRTTTATSVEWWESCRQLRVAHVGVRIADARQADVERAAELGAKLNLWTARADEELERALELGCDTITVDDPAWAFALMAQRVTV
ncbi:MAG: glycerophosphodiester phosphodiesterase, partial [Brachybacterium sp.]